LFIACATNLPFEEMAKAVTPPYFWPKLPPKSKEDSYFTPSKNDFSRALSSG